MRRSSVRPLVTVALAAVLVAAASGCRSADPADGAAAPDTTPVPTTIVPLTAPPSTDPPGTRSYRLYWMRDCPPPETATEVSTCRLAVGGARLSAAPDVATIATEAVEALIRGPDEDEVALGMTTNLRSITDLDGVTVEDGIATVSVNRYFETAVTRPQVAQVVFTLTQFPEIDAVAFLVDGATNGATGVGPQDRAGSARFVPGVLVEQPSLGAAAGAVFTLAGTTNLDGATATFAVTTPDGRTLASGTIGALSATPGLDSFEQVVAIDDPSYAGPAAVVVDAGAGLLTTPVGIGG